jgi:GNAT superfamily N-acetyltransferase
VTPVTTEYDRGRRGDVLDLLERVWGARMSDEEFGWWFERNPAGDPIVSLAEDGGRVVAVATMSVFRVRADGEILTVPMPMHVATDPVYRGRGLFRALERANEETARARGFDLALSFPNEASERVFLARLGWRALPRPRVWASSTVLLGRAGRGIDVRPVERFDADVAAVAPADNGIVRDACHLNWRYAAAPRAYRLLAAYDDAGFAGYAVGGTRAVRGRRIGYLADLAARPAAVGPLLARAAAEVRAPVFLALEPVRRRGFVPTPRTMRLIGKSLSGDRAVPERWRFTLGDLDVF